MSAPRGLVLTASGSGSGKTLITLGLLRAYRDRGTAVAGAKSGPDYIDPGFHVAACGRQSVNLDAWAMDPASLRARAGATDAPLLLIEGAMGALDGARPCGAGSTADLAACLGVPLVMVIDIRHAAQSAVLAPAGLAALRPDVTIAGAILNGSGSDAHAAMARGALERAGIAVFGALRRIGDLTLPSRHLGLVPAGEAGEPALEAFCRCAGAAVAAHIDLDALAGAARPLTPGGALRRLAPPGQRIAVARDHAFAFAYPHLMDDWCAAGAEVIPFAPLADEAPDSHADAVFLPGGYPELHAGRLAAAARFRSGMTAAAARGALIYGECGGYMALGRVLTDAEGTHHRMLDLLPVETSFATRHLSLGYRRLAPCPGAPWQGGLAGHEFHYATVTAEGPGPALFTACDAAGAALAPMGLALGRVSGSFAHVIAPAD